VKDDNLMIGINTSDDAAVYKINENQAIILTTDFFTPIVDDPYMFGQIAACNALSDVYAMGGRPLVVLNAVAFPEELAEDILPEVLRGGFDKVIEAGAVVGGGHSIKCTEPIYGLAVLGEVSPDKVITNSGAKPGDILVITKPLGFGIASTALKADMLDSETYREMVNLMATLNKEASEAAIEVGVNSITDITGFGLVGHAFEMASASGVTIKIQPKSVPLLQGVDQLAKMGLLPAGLYRNKNHFSDNISSLCQKDDFLYDIIFDPQTSGGLLLSVNRTKAQTLLDKLLDRGITDAAVVGEVLEAKKSKIIIGD
jgi:selenide,water dikinase